MSVRRARLLALHRWAGLGGGWLLFAVFLWGTLSVYDTEITDWMEPEIRAGAADPVAGAQVAGDMLRRHARDAAWWQIELPGPRSARVRVSWCGRRGRCGEASADATTGRVARATHGGDLFFELHYGLLLGTAGAIVVGLGGLVLLAVVASGIWVQFRRLLPDLTQLRLDGAAARAWRDAHLLTGVATAPFLLVFAYSGVLVFAFATVPTTIAGRYRTGSAGYFADFDMTVPWRTAPARLAPAPDGVTLADAVRRAEALPGMAGAGFVRVDAPGDPARRRITITEPDGVTLPLRRGTAVIDGRTGAVLALGPSRGGAPVRTARLLYGIHFARWGGRGVRALYAASGAIGTASIAAALALFGAARRRRSPSAPLALVDRVSLALTLGLLDASVAPFWANRLLGAQLVWREAGETGALLLTAAAALVVALAGRRPAPALLGAGAALGLGLPFLDLATAPVGTQPVLHAAVDGTIVAFGLAAALAWAAIHRRSRR